MLAVKVAQLRASKRPDTERDAIARRLEEAATRRQTAQV